MSAEELTRLRDDVPLGRHKLRIEECVFRFADYEQFLDENAVEISAFRETQQAAFQEERRRWEEAGLSMDAPAEEAVEEAAHTIPDGCHALESPVTGSVWKIESTVGGVLEPGPAAVILEAMKMEIALEAEDTLEVIEILVAEGASVRAGQPLIIVRSS